jgi:diguanylate cyclase (GGDEF)-like protein
MSTAARTVSIMLTALAATALMGWLDTLLGERVHTVLFYLLPILLVALTLSRRWVILTALLASLTWTAVQFHTSGFAHPVSVIWNEAAALTIYLLVGLSLARLRLQRQSLEAANARINELLAAEQRDSRTDSLTGLPNRRHFNETLELEIARSRRDHHPFCLLYLDLDNFKLVNDRHGHVVGDEVLKLVAEALRRNLRASDVPARLGGDEFAALLWHAEYDGAEHAGHRVMHAVREFAAAYTDCNFSASIGIAWFQRPPADPDEALDEADAAMYEAKQTKDRVVIVNVERDDTQIAIRRPTESL